MFNHNFSSANCLGFLFLGINDFVINICEKNPVHSNNKIVEMIISNIIKIGLWLNTPKELITEIPAGTNKKPILFVSVVPTFSTSPSLTIPVHKAINNKTRPITDAGIGIGMKLSIIFDKSMMIASTST